MKKLLLTVILSFLFIGAGFSYTIYWSTGKFYNLTPPFFPERPAPNMGDGLNNFSVATLGCSIVSDAEVNNLLIENTGVLTISNNATLTINTSATIDAGTVINVQPGATLIITNSISNNGTINVQVGGNLIQTGAGSATGTGYNISATGTGTATRYNLWSSPVSGGSITSVFGSSNHCDIYHFNASGQEWVRMSSSNACEPVAPFTGSTSFNSGNGVLIPGGGSATFSGTINNNAVSPSLSSASSGGTWTGDGWNLIGNPYPSTINATTFINANSFTSGTLYFWADDGSSGGSYDQSADFATRNLSGGTAASGGGGGGAPTNYIAVGQGFFVQSATGGSATFTNAMRESGTATFFKSEPENIQRVWLNANNSSNGSSQILIAFTDNATNGADWGYDSKKLVSNADFIFGSSIELENEPFVIQSLNKDVLEIEKEVALTLFTKHSGVSYIELAETENFDANVVIYLKDYSTGKIQDLSTGPFSVYLNANETYDSRFVLVFKNQSNSPNSVSNNIKSAYVSGYEYDGTLFIKSPKEGLKLIRIVNMNGSVIETISLNGDNNSEITVSHLSPGLYVAQVSTTSGSNKTVKFIIK